MVLKTFFGCVCFLMCNIFVFLSSFHHRGQHSFRDFFERYPLKVRNPSRLLKLAGDSEYHYKKQRWVSLQRFFSKYLPNNFYLHDAIAIDLNHSLLLLVWKEPQVFITCHFLLKFNLK